MDLTLLIIAGATLVLSGWVLRRALRSDVVSPYLVVSLWFVLLLWYGVPTFLVAPFVGEQRRLVGSLAQDYLQLLVVGNAAFLGAVLMLLRRRPYFRRVASLTTPPTGAASVEWAVVVFVAAGVVLELGTATLFGETYLERNAFQTTQQNTAAYEAAGTIAFMTALVTSVTLAYLTGAASMHGRPKRLATAAAWVWLAYICVVVPLRGARIAMLMPLVLVAFAAVRSQWSPGRALKWLVISALTIVAGGSASIFISEARAGGTFSLSGVLESSAESMTTNTSRFWVALTGEVTEKFNNPLGGTLLLAREGPEAAGLAPFVGSVLSFVPRLILPDKPVPGSADGTYAGHPTRIAAVLLGHDEAAGNVQVSPAAVTIWEIGYWGLPLLVLVNGAYLTFVNSMLLATLLSRRVLGFFMLGAPAFITLVPSIDVCIQGVIRVGFVALAITIGVRVVRSAVPARTVSGSLPKPVTPPAQR